MNTYIYKNQNVTVTIQANDSGHAFCLLCERIRQLDDMGVHVPNAWYFDLQTTARVRNYDHA